MVFLGTLNAQLDICSFDSNGLIIVPGCYDLAFMFDWIRSRVLSIVVVIMIFFLPLFLQGKLMHFLVYESSN